MISSSVRRCGDIGVQGSESALDLCRVAGQRASAADTGLTADGPDADAVLASHLHLLHHVLHLEAGTVPHGDVDGDLATAVVAVLDRVHRRLGDGCAQPLPLVLGQPKVAERIEDPAYDVALVALVARDRERHQLACERTGLAQACSAEPFEGDHRDVVLLLDVGPGEPGELGDAEVRELHGRRRHPDDPGGTREAEHLPCGVVLLCEPVAVEEQLLARLDDGRRLLVDDARHQPQRHPCRAQLPHRPVANSARRPGPCRARTPYR